MAFIRDRLRASAVAIESALASDPVTTSPISNEHVGSRVRVEMPLEPSAPAMTASEQNELPEGDESEGDERRQMRLP